MNKWFFFFKYKRQHSKLQNWCNAGQGHWQNMFPLTKSDKLLAISNTVIQQQ